MLINKKNMILLFFQDVVRKVENVDVNGSSPQKDVKITECGVIKVEEPFNVEK